MKQGLSKATRVGWVWTSLEQVSGKVVTLIVGLALARLLEPEAFGIIATVSIFINVMQQLVNGGSPSEYYRNQKLTIVII